MKSRLQIREAVAGEGVRIAQIRIAGWRWAYREIVPDGFLQKMDPAAEALKVEAAIADPDNPFGRAVVLADENIAGFAVYSRPLPQFCDVSEIKALYVHPEVQRSGAGSALLQHCMDEFRPHFETLKIWCLEKNPIGRGFYEKQGGKLQGEAQPFSLEDAPAVELTEVCYVWRLR